MPHLPRLLSIVLLLLGFTIESITVGSRFWNFWVDDGTPVWGGGADLVTVPRYAAGPCAGMSPGQCRFGTRTFVTIGGRIWESITR